MFTVEFVHDKLSYTAWPLCKQKFELTAVKGQD